MSDMINLFAKEREEEEWGYIDNATEEDLNKLKAAVSKQGVDVRDVDNRKLARIAKLVNIEPTCFFPRPVKIHDHYNRFGKVVKFVKTPRFIANGREHKGLFVRVEIVDQVIKDLQQGLELLKNTKEVL